MKALLAFLKKYVWAAVIVTALTGTAVGWLKGLASSYLPDTEPTRCWIEEQWQAAVGAAPRRDPDRFTILIARLANDADGSESARLAAAFHGQRGFRPLTACRSIVIGGGDQIEAEQTAQIGADRLRTRRGADLVLWGEVADRGALRVWMTGPTVRADLKGRPWTVDKGVLEPAFSERFATALQAAALAALAPAEEREGSPVADLLRPLLPRLRSLVADLPAGFTAESKGSLLFASAWSFQSYGEQTGDNAALQEAVDAYRVALQERMREVVPLDWAATQNNLGAALAILGERESGTARLEQAVAAYQAALQERTRERVPLDWAGTQNNLGTALWRLGERESGTARLEQAVAAYQAALQERTRERVPLGWAMTQNNLGIALATLGERESGAARLKQAVAAYQAALQEWTRERVPLQWATTQNNLGTTLATLGERESGTARLQEAVAAYEAALVVFMPANADYYTRLCRDNRDRALALIASRTGKKKG